MNLEFVIFNGAEWSYIAPPIGLNPKPLSIALLGGLSISTIFTLVIVPTIYGAIRNKIPLKDYDKKDFESKKDFIK